MAVSFVARTVCLALALGSSLVTPRGTVPVAAAAEKDELSNARAKFQQAIEMEQGGNHAQALQMFREVGQVRMTPQVRYHIAYCEEKLGRLVTALGGYQLAQKEAEGLNPEFQKELEDRTSSLRARIPKIVIERGEGAKAATIELDGVALGAASVGVEVPIDPGPHTISAKAPGYKPYTSTTEVPESQLERISITLEKIEDEEKPDEPSEVAPEVVPEKHVPTTRVVAYATGGLAIVAGATTIVFWSKRSSALKTMKSLCGEDQSCEDNWPELSPEQERKAIETNDDLGRYNNLFVVGAVTTGAALVATGVLIGLEVFESKPKKSTAMTLSVTPSAPGATLGGMSLFGRF